MVYRGKLEKKMCRDGVHYCMFYNGNYYDFMDNLNCMLSDNVRLNIKSGQYDVFGSRGKLKRKKDRYGRYRYFVGSEIVDTVLENLVEKDVEIDLKCITEEKCNGFGKK